MLDDQTMSLQELLDNAAAAARLGDREEAERLYRRATERSPANSTAWLGLAGAVEAPEEKRRYFERALVINPSNGEARAALQLLAERMDGEQAVEINAVLQEAAARDANAQAEATRPPQANISKSDPEDVVIAPNSVAGGDVLYCSNHPEIETTLRCYRCNKPVCTRCVERTPVGYLCKECIRERQGIFYTAGNLDYVIAAGVGFVLAAVASPFVGLLLGFFGFFGWIIAFILGPTVGASAATIIRRSVGRRRGRYLGLVVSGAVVLGTLVGIAFGSLFRLPVNLLVLGIFLFLSLSTIYASLR